MPANFCPECGVKTGGANFCPECGRPLSDDSAQNNIVHRSTVETHGSLEDSVVSRSTVTTDRTAIKDAVISHSTITQTETHQHFGESVGTFDTQMELGRTAFEGRNYDEAVDFFNAALRIDSRGYEPWFLKGVSCAELKRTDEAVTNLRKALKAPDSQKQRVVGELKGLVERTTKSAMVLETQATDLLSKADIELEYSYKYKAGPKTEKGKGVMGVLALDLSAIPVIGPSMRTTSAASSLEDKQEADKREAEGHKLEDQAKDLLSGAVKLYNSAIRYCDLVIEFNRQDEFCWLKRGEIFLRLRLYPDACSSYEAVLAFNPYHREALRLRGMCYTAQGIPIPPPPGPPSSQSAMAAGTASQPLPTSQPPGAAQAAMPPTQPHSFPVQSQHSPVAPSPTVPPPSPSPLPSSQIPFLDSQSSPPRAAQAPMPPAQPQTVPQPSQPPMAHPSPVAPPSPVPPPSLVPSQPLPGADQMQKQPQQQPRMPQQVQHSSANPCPYCRSEMSFVRERSVWFCGSCKRFSDRPAR